MSFFSGYDFSTDYAATPTYDYSFYSSPPAFDYSIYSSPPAFDYSFLSPPPDYSYSFLSPPSYGLTAPSVFDYSSWVYDSTPSWMTPPPVFDAYTSNPYDFSSTTSPYSYESTLFPDPVYSWSPTPSSQYYDAFDNWLERSIATGDPYGLTDPTGRSAELYNEMTSAYTNFVPDAYGSSYAAGMDAGLGSSYGDIGGDIYSGVSNLGAYDFGTDADYGTSYGASLNQPFDSGVQVAAIDPRLLFGGTMTDAPLYQPNLYDGFTEGITAGTQMPGSVNPQNLPSVAGGVESGMTSNVGITPLADGSAIISRPDGSSVTLDSEQVNKLLSGDNSVLGGASNEDKPTEKFGAITNIAKDDFSLDGYTSAASQNFASSGNPSYTKYPVSYGDVPVEDRVGTPVVKESVNYELPSYVGKGAPVVDYKIDPLTGEVVKTTATQTQGLQPNRVSNATFESNYTLNPERVDGYVRGSGQIDPDRVPKNADVYKDLDLTDKTYRDYVDPNRPLGTGALPTGRTIDESLLPPDLRKYSTLDPNTQYTIGPDGKPIPAYMNRDEVANRTVVPASLQKYTSLPSAQSSGTGKGGGGGGGGGAPPKKQDQPAEKKSGMNPALLALLAALLAKSGKGEGGSGIALPGYGLEREQAELAKDRRAGSSAQRYYTGPGTVKKAAGGITSLQSSLGGYSDGGRLLRGPGDGVSDSIPAVIGKKQPARLADGEFVVPARIVSELGNGSTEAGARKLYAMMDRIQKARKKTVGKNRVAHNSRADKYLPK